MKERLLQYIWQFQYFNKNELTTVRGESLHIVHPGNFNSSQGPDFLNARVKLNDTLWAGNIELHILSSDWDLHRHSADANFNNIVLHVVWLHDHDIKDARQNSFPTLELHSRVSKILLSRYSELMKGVHFIPCENQIHAVGDFVLSSWKERLLVERLQKRSAVVFEFLIENNAHWEETFWWMTASGFGGKVNGAAFLKVARSIPVSLLHKHKHTIHQLESLLFGQAGLLNGHFKNDYPMQLQNEYIFLRKKYRLAPVDEPLFFLRMRPANFPTVRMAQLAMLVYSSRHLFAQIKEISDIFGIKRLLTVYAGSYWNNHYVFDDESVTAPKKTGNDMVNGLLINTIVPAVFAYGRYHNEPLYKERALTWLREMASEKNSITMGFESLNISNKSSFDSQSLIQLKNEYCDVRRCLDCAAGNTILKLSASLG